MRPPLLTSYKIKALIARVRSSEFLRHATILSSGTALAQCASIFTAPLLTRIYAPEDYGLLGVYMVFTALVSGFSTLQFHNAIVVAQTDEIAKKVLQLSILITALVSICIALLVFIFTDRVANLYNVNDHRNFFLLAPLSVFFTGFNLILSSWAIRKKQFALLSYNRIITALISPIVAIVLGRIILGPCGLFVGLLVSQIIPTIKLAFHFVKAEKFRMTHRVGLRELLKRFKNFPLFSFPAEFINNLSNQMPVIILSQSGGAAVVGLYGLSVRLLGMPSSLVSSAVGDVFRQRAAKDYMESGTCKPIFVKVFKSLLTVSILPLVVLLLFGPEIFSFVFGEKWSEAGQISQILAILYTFKFIISPLSYVTLIAGKQWVGLIVDILLFAVLLFIYYLSGKLSLDYKTTLMIYATAYSALYFLTFYLSLKFTTNGQIASQH